MTGLLKTPTKLGNQATEKGEKPTEPSGQVIEKGKKIILKKECKKIYDVFLDKLKFAKDSLEKLILESAKNPLQQRKFYQEKEIISFILDHSEEIFSNINPKDIEPLSDERFCQLLLAIYKEIKAQGLANEKGLKKDKIQQLVTKCVNDARGAEAWNWLVDSIKSKIPMRELLEKIPGAEKYLGIGEKKDRPKSDTEMVTSTLSGAFVPVAIFVIVASIFNMSPLMIALGIVGIMLATGKAIKELFTNDKEGTLYNPNTQEVKEDWDKKILSGIESILKDQVEGTEKNTNVPGEQLKATDWKKNVPEEQLKRWTDRVYNNLDSSKASQLGNSKMPTA